MFNKVMKCAKRGWEMGSGAARAVALGCAAVVCAVTVGGTAFAADGSVSIPDIGVDWGDVATQGAAKVGVVLLAGVGVIIAIGLFRMGCRFFSNAFSGKA